MNNFEVKIGEYYPVRCQAWQINDNYQGRVITDMLIKETGFSYAVVRFDSFMGYEDYETTLSLSTLYSIIDYANI